MMTWLFTVSCFAILLLLGCGGSARPKPFIDVAQEPTYMFYPVHNMAQYSTQRRDEAGDQIIHYLRQLIANQQLNDAMYVCNDYLLSYPDTPYREYLNLTKIKIQFLQNILSQRGVTKARKKRDIQPRKHFRYEGLSESLGTFLTETGFQRPGKYEMVSFNETGYPTKDNFDYFMSLIEATHPRIDSLRFSDDDKGYAAEQQSFRTFLEEFEDELVWLRIWRIIREKEWEMAITYADSMSQSHPSLAADFQYLKEAIQNRKPPPKGKSVKAAEIASLIVPGAGSMYAGKTEAGLGWLIMDVFLVGSAAYLLGGSDYKEDRAETYFGGIFAIGAAAWHLASSEKAGDQVATHNARLRQQQFNEFIRDLEIRPPGVK
jgi:hypothetical protein